MKVSALISEILDKDLSSLFNISIRLIRRNPVTIRLEQWLRYSRCHTATLDPFLTIHVDPSKIRDLPQKPISKSEQHLSHVVGGDWDMDSLPFEDRIFYRSLERHFTDNVPWPETRLYQQALTGEFSWRSADSRSELEHRCNLVDELYHDIKNHGYKSRNELETPTFFPHEVKIAIGRQGNFFYINGKHRLAIAKILSLPAIPVNITLRHSEWQALRNEIASKKQKISDHNHTHPDLTYLTNW